MLPNYSGRLFDKLMVLATRQTSAIRLNPDDQDYVAERVRIIKALAWALWQARDELQARRRAQKTP
jgi:hypothetical protein